MAVYRGGGINEGGSSLVVQGSTIPFGYKKTENFKQTFTVLNGKYTWILEGVERDTTNFWPANGVVPAGTFAKKAGNEGRSEALAAGEELGMQYSISLGSQPHLDNMPDKNGNSYPLSNVGVTGSTGAYRIPSINKTTLPNGTTRLIAAFDVRYRADSIEANGDVGQGSVYGSDINVVFSDDLGKTWVRAVNKNTNKAPAIDVDNAYGPDGKPSGTSLSSVELTSDVCDPQLTVDPENPNIIWCGMAGGAGFLGRNWTKSNFRFFKSTDYGETWEEATNPQNSFARSWKPSNHSGSMRGNLTGPGNGIVLTKDVPKGSMKKGMMVLPCQMADSLYGYLAYGNGDISQWTSASNISLGKEGAEEGQVIQLDDGRIMMLYKNSGMKFSIFDGEVWTDVNYTGRTGANSQNSILKVKDGEKDKSYGVVVMAAPWSGAPRANITLRFARDTSGTIEGSDLDDSEWYFVNIRTEAQRYFGYTDMVMIDDVTLGLLYENEYDGSGANNQGMRFIALDVSEVINKLSTIPAASN